MMDAQKTIVLTMQEIKELKICLQEKARVLKQGGDQIAEKNALNTIERILQKLEQ